MKAIIIYFKKRNWKNWKKWGEIKFQNSQEKEKLVNHTIRTILYSFLKEEWKEIEFSFLSLLEEEKNVSEEKLNKNKVKREVIENAIREKRWIFL